MNYYCPGIMLSALGGGAGKTLFSIGLLAYWREQGKTLVPFKKGPDYIDAAWLGMAAGRSCHHLDPYLMDWDRILGSYVRRSRGAEGAVIEGNRGLYDGVDPAGSCSTAELAKCLGTPVVVILDATKTTRTTAAMVLGLCNLDPDVPIRGVVLNRVAGLRHETILRRSIEQYTGVRVFGAIPRLKDFPFPERHLGLVPPQEHALQRAVIAQAADAVGRYIDPDAIWDLAAGARTVSARRALQSDSPKGHATWARIGVIQDRAFHFYYPENLEALEAEGLQLVPFSALSDPAVPDVEALYIGGGFPEVYAEELAGNRRLCEHLRQLIEDGLPVYAECGGLIYLGRTLQIGERHFPMVGALPLATAFQERPQGHGYTKLRTVQPNPFYETGSVLKGHEFHYSRIASLEEDRVTFAFRVLRGNGIDGRREGIVRRNVLATYTHVHALGCPFWSTALQRAAGFRGRNTAHDELLMSGSVR
jgi:cobyrinic acid a,c-diamide synthase